MNTLSMTGADKAWPLPTVLGACALGPLVIGVSVGPRKVPQSYTRAKYDRSISNKGLPNFIDVDMTPSGNHSGYAIRCTITRANLVTRLTRISEL